MLRLMVGPLELARWWWCSRSDGDAAIQGQMLHQAKIAKRSTGQRALTQRRAGGAGCGGAAAQRGRAVRRVARCNKHTDLFKSNT